MTNPDAPEKMTTAPTREQRAAVRGDHAQHRSWLREHGIAEVAYRLLEDSYTGLILSALLEEPDTAASVLGALLAGLPTRPDITPLPVSAYSPSSIVDLVVPMQCQGCPELLIAEHKRHHSHSNAPGSRNDPDAPWQTDQAYEGATGLRDAPWLYGDLRDVEAKTFVVLDVWARPMDRTFYWGEHNDKWALTSYARFGAVLRAEHERGVPHLVPLLSALYVA